jgi:hypothetical protein
MINSQLLPSKPTNMWITFGEVIYEFGSKVYYFKAMHLPSYTLHSYLTRLVAVSSFTWESNGALS